MTSAPLPPPTTNAAKWLATGGHCPAKRLSARRVAGTRVPRGLLVHRTANHQAFATLAKAHGITRPLHAVRLDRPQRLAPVQVAYHSAQPQPPELWRRSPHGPADIALSCIAHLVPDERLSLLPLSALTRIDVSASPRARVTLATDAGLRARMGVAGQARALNDLSAVIPQIQPLWGERAAMLPQALGTAGPRNADNAKLPIGPAPEQVVEGHLTHSALDRATRHPSIQATNPRADVAASFARRRPQPPDRRPRAPAADPYRLHCHRPDPRNLGQGSALTGLQPYIIARATLWLAKYHFQEDTP